MTNFIATAANGTTVTRASKTMAYTHCVMSTDYTGTGFYSWHKTAAAAFKAMAGYQAKAAGYTASYGVAPVTFEVVEVVEVDAAEYKLAAAAAKANGEKMLALAKIATAADKAANAAATAAGASYVDALRAGYAAGIAAVAAELAPAVEVAEVEAVEVEAVEVEAAALAARRAANDANQIATIAAHQAKLTAHDVEMTAKAAARRQAARRAADKAKLADRRAYQATLQSSDVMAPVAEVEAVELTGSDIEAAAFDADLAARRAAAELAEAVAARQAARQAAADARQVAAEAELAADKAAERVAELTEARQAAVRLPAVFGDLSIEASTGETLTASNDLQLAWAWAEVESNAAPEMTGGWDSMAYGVKCEQVADALRELRRAFHDQGTTAAPAAPAGLYERQGGTTAAAVAARLRRDGMRPLYADQRYRRDGLSVSGGAGAVHVMASVCLGSSPRANLAAEVDLADRAEVILAAAGYRVTRTNPSALHVTK